MGKQIPITEGLFTWPSEKPQLIGGTCKSCGSYFFPKRSISHKPSCPNEEIEEVLLSLEGKLISYTWQYYQPPPPYKGPEPFVPFGLGLVELAEGVRVNGIMTGCQLEDLKLNMDVKLVVEKLYDDEQGNEYLTWKFRPV
ncbi:Zn-ribbon domain-containing OB-fold protein [Chloroflexota bacterium]